MKHPHADIMLEYAKVAQTTDRPWEQFEYSSGDNWQHLTSHPNWGSWVNYCKIEPVVHRVGNHYMLKLSSEPDFDGEVCVLAKIDVQKVVIINIRTGRRWLNVEYVTCTGPVVNEFDFKKCVGIGEFKLVKEYK